VLGTKVSSVLSSMAIIDGIKRATNAVEALVAAVLKKVWDLLLYVCEHESTSAMTRTGCGMGQGHT
jgi:hypothetical protein